MGADVTLGEMAHPVRCRVPGYCEPRSEGARVFQLKKWRQLKKWLPGDGGGRDTRLPLQGVLTILKLTCWVRGTHSSTFG